MSTAASDAFIDWLNKKLHELNTDESVFGSYIIGILEGDETEEEKTDAVEGILSEIIEDNLNAVVTEILNKWNDCHPKDGDGQNKPVTIDVNEQLARLLESQKLPTVKERQYTEEERKIKEQILAQYSQTEVSEDDYEESDDEAANPQSSKAGLERNTNALDVMNLQKEKREQARLESAAKKQKDKEDREKQKQMREEKKEKRKTVKGERRR